MAYFGSSYQELCIDPPVCTLGLISRGCLLYKQLCETMKVWSDTTSLQSDECQYLQWNIILLFNKGMQQDMLTFCPQMKSKEQISGGGGLGGVRREHWDAQGLCERLTLSPPPTSCSSNSLIFYKAALLFLQHEAALTEKQPHSLIHSFPSLSQPSWR